MSQAVAWAPPGWCTQWRRRRGLQTGAERRLPALDTSAALVAVRAKMAPQAADGNGPAAGRLAVAYPRAQPDRVKAAGAPPAGATESGRTSCARQGTTQRLPLKRERPPASSAC